MSQQYTTPVTPSKTVTLDPPHLQSKDPALLKRKTIAAQCNDIDSIAQDCMMARRKVDRLMRDWFNAKDQLRDYVESHRS